MSSPLFGVRHKQNALFCFVLCRRCFSFFFPAHAMCVTHGASDLDNCNFVDADAAELPACFESFGKADVETL